MSRRRQDIEYEYVAVDIECSQGHRVGLVDKAIGSSPRAGKYTTRGGVNFEDVPTPSADSGRVRGVCDECGADVQVRWDRVRDLLDRNTGRGRHTDSIRP